MALYTKAEVNQEKVSNRAALADKMVNQSVRTVQ